MNILLIIDPQNDFVSPEGALSVKGAKEDMDRLTDFILHHGKVIDKVIITMDSHMPGHISTPSYWQDKSGAHPLPFTSISFEDAEKGIWNASTDNAKEYLKQLEKAGKTHIIWPPHCLFGTYGWTVYEPLYKAAANWAEMYNKEFGFYTKGMDSRDTEMFSVVKPEVSFDNETVNSNAERFLSILDGYDAILIAGEAENFCVKESVRDIISMRPNLVSKIIILKDCMSRIPVLGDKTDEFWESLKIKGMTITESRVVDFYKYEVMRQIH